MTREIELLRNKKLTITLDGHSSSGKSTLAKDLSKLLDIVHVDSGAMYRAVALYFLQNDIDPHNEDLVSKALKKITIDFRKIDDVVLTFLNDQLVEKEIREMQVSEFVSDVAAVSQVRKFLVDQQRKMAQNNGIIMDGRDIGTVVFPNADVKLFVTASHQVRSQRRFDELKSRGLQVKLEVISKNLAKRDNLDSNRKDSPLKQAKDAIVLDTSTLDRGSMLSAAIKIIHNRV